MVTLTCLSLLLNFVFPIDVSASGRLSLHREQEPELSQFSLRALTSKLRKSESMRQRIEILESIAGLPESEDNSALALTRGVAAGAEDDAYSVRKLAIELLPDAPDQEAALAALIKAARGQAKWESKIWKGAVDTKPGSFVHEQDRREVLDRQALREAMDSIKSMERLIESHELARSLRSTLSTSLGLFQDDRAAQALLVLLRSSNPDHHSDATIDALLRFGTQSAVAGVVRVLEDFEDSHRSLEEALEESRENEDAEPLIRMREEFNATSLAWGNALRERLIHFAAEHGLPAVPESPLASRAWKSWLRESKPKLPEHVVIERNESADDEQA